MVRIVNGMIVAEGSTTSVQDEASTPLFENRSSTSGFGQSTVDVFGFQLPSYVVAGGSLLVLFWFGFKGLLLGGLLYVLYKRFGNASPAQYQSSGGRGGFSRGGGGPNVKTISDLPPPPRGG
eukprot:CAMPEP_0172604262 /NCGR_PEP_ID=MMETSP1068-20121228/24516_1 /TAXON_ID=35684 /ORGANISM="Pseudopedinella elastica, Strain CCMP716" /LENGTH=121 /DNA_ID=CAMNT_0013406263 /DNA_START=169 /DNA_END=534 /DNA_ORIENTATION=+